MAENSKIEWTDHTFNPWRGCTKVSPGCAHCYAETLSHRNPAVLGEWGPGRPRIKASPAMWRQPLKWNREAGDREFEHDSEAPLHDPGDLAPYVRPRVFCASLADWLDDEVPVQWLADLLALIHATPNLDWLMLTKRPQNLNRRIFAVWEQDPDRWNWLQNWYHGAAPANVWMGTSVEDQTRADERIPHLLAIPARVRFLSCEPLLGPVDLREPVQIGRRRVMEGILPTHVAGDVATTFKGLDGIHWVIAGGESGPHARPMHPDWASGLRDQCAAANVPFFFKQWGEWAPMPAGGIGHVGKKKAGRTLDGRIHDEFPTP